MISYHPTDQQDDYARNYNRHSTPDNGFHQLTPSR
jgi:hypothetical protein